MNANNTQIKGRLFSILFRIPRVVYHFGESPHWQQDQLVLSESPIALFDCPKVSLETADVKHLTTSLWRPEQGACTGSNYKLLCLFSSLYFRYDITLVFLRLWMWVGFWELHSGIVNRALKIFVIKMRVESDRTESLLL